MPTNLQSSVLLGWSLLLGSFVAVPAQHLMLATPFGGSTGTMEGFRDLDGDGVRDVAVGAGNVVAIYSGRSGLLLWQQGISIEDAQVEVADMNADGIEDLIVGDEQNFFDPGQITILNGVTLMPMAVLPNPNPPTIAGFGRRVHVLGDMDGDTIPDLGVNSLDVTNWPTIVYIAWVISGATGAVLFTISDVSDTQQGMASIGDLNADGIEDFLVVERSRFAVYAGGSWNLLWSRPATQGETPCAAALGVGDVDQDGVPDWALRYRNHLEVISGATGSVSLLRFLGIGPVYHTLDQSGVDLDGHGGDPCAERVRSAEI